MVDRRETIRRALKERFGGNVQAMADAAHVRRATLHDIVKPDGHTSHITERVWDALSPVCIGHEVRLVQVGQSQQACRLYTTRRVRVYGMAQAKGITDWHGDIVPDDEHELDTVEAPDDNRRYVAFKVEGDSMEPRIHDGDIVIADLDLEPQPGHIVVAKWDDTIMCKRYRRYGRQVVLESLNPRYDPVQVRPSWMLRVRRVMCEV